MIIDTSSLTAILLEEPEARRLVTSIAASATRLLPAPCFVETSLVVFSRNGENGLRDLDLFVSRGGIGIVPFTESQARLARAAFKLFGKGRHPAKLNFGDCMAYAVAKETKEELLFKGTDFAQTDIAVATY